MSNRHSLLADGAAAHHRSRVRDAWCAGSDGADARAAAVCPDGRVDGGARRRDDAREAARAAEHVARCRVRRERAAEPMRVAQLLLRRRDRSAGRRALIAGCARP